jgi:superfamily I DNA/RNA helicase
LGHDGYLKLWSISRPSLKYDFILLDEAQDTNAAVIDALSAQRVQTVYVGDKYQQIYGFRGAFNAMEKIHVPTECALTTSFRFGEAVADIANALLGKFGEARRILGNPVKKSTINTMAGTTKIYRTNMGLLSGLAATLGNGGKPFLAGGVGDLSALLNDVALMQSGQPAISNSDFFGFKNWHDLVSFAKTLEGASYQTEVQIFETYGVQQLKLMLERVEKNASDADVILTTAHKSKGKEWAHVEVCDDFATKHRMEYFQQPTYSFDDPSVEEITLLYVALTRAQESLRIPEKILHAINLSKYCRDSHHSG